MFDIILFSNLSEPTKLSKSLTNSTNFTGALVDECTIESPSILLEVDNLTTFNYCYIPLFKRYYFITNQTFVRNGLVRIDLKVDVLNTYKDTILQQKAILVKSKKTNKSSQYINDNSLVTESKTYEQVINFPEHLPYEPSYIMVVAGHRQ